MTHENYSTKNIIYYALAGAAGLALTAAAIWIGIKKHKEGLERKIREEDARVAEYGIG